MIEILSAVVLALATLFAWALNVLSIPGNWLMLAFAAIYAYFMPPENRVDISWQVLLALLILAVLGEIVEFAAGAMGAARSGGSKRGALLALVGSVVGGIMGIFIGVPVPVVGSLIAALLFASVGALIGAVIGERWKGRAMEESLEVGQGAFWGRLLGTLGKAMVGAVMWATILVALFV